MEKSIMKSVLGMALWENLKAVYHGLSKQSLTWFWSRANMGNTLLKQGKLRFYEKWDIPNHHKGWISAFGCTHLHFGHENVLSRSRLVVPRNSSASSLCLEPNHGVDVSISEQSNFPIHRWRGWNRLNFWPSRKKLKDKRILKTLWKNQNSWK